MTATSQRYDLTARYESRLDGPILLTGVQAVARLLVEQHVRDAADGLRTASFVSGYQGSPLGGLDRTLAGIPSLRDRHDVHVAPAVNEELAATAVWGSQQEPAGLQRTFDGVVGLWYGKSPGVDRAGDALRHGHVIGAHPRGGVLVLAGDDPGAKSSTLPCASERTLAAYGMPVLYPRDSAEIITLGGYGIALSRASGCWVGMKITTDVADGLWSLDPGFGDVEITVPTIEWDGKPWSYTQGAGAFPPTSLLAEQELAGPRWAMVRAFGDANPLDDITGAHAGARLGIIAPGKTHNDLMQALHNLGLDDQLERAGIRLLRLGMINPLAPERVNRFAAGLEEILVVEEKNAFVETQLKELLYGTTSAPHIIGKSDALGRPLIPADGELTADRITGPLRQILADRVPLRPEPPRRVELPLLPIQRTPYFCSGCPHNRSTVVPEGSLVGGGIGCHGMMALMPRAAATFTGLTQMGGEGAQWIGQAPFTDTAHLFQNLGDGTYFHSGQLAVQACVAAGVTITFKILYNAAVAMTGGQDAEGAVGVPELTRKLHAEGVRRIIVCSEEPSRYSRDAAWAPGVDIWSRDRLEDAQELLRDTPGVTVLIYDQQCAAEARRRRKRGLQPVRTRRVIINEEVCEGCGDCGAKSNCLSVQPVDTEFGRKTRIDQTSCNTDYSCLDGDCPSFATVEVPSTMARTSEVEPPEPPAAPAPPLVSDETHNVVLTGIGGTGIVTVNQVLATAALFDGLRVEGLDQTGLSQKAGPVTSHLRFAGRDLEPVNRVGSAQADCLLAFDLLTATDNRQLTYAGSNRTRAIVSTSPTPTGSMVHDPGVSAPRQHDLLARLEKGCHELTALDTLGASQRLFGDAISANMLLVGAAVQTGALPLTPDSVESAITLNDAAVAVNIAAFRWGRLAVADPARFLAATSEPEAAPRRQYTFELPPGSPLTGETRRLTEIRAGQLCAYQNPRLARRYLELVEVVWAAERAMGERTEFSEAVAKGLHHLMAYKDEYEVARLLTDPAFSRRIAEEFPGASQLRLRLHPPVLRALGLKRKIALGPLGRAGLRVLARCKFLRGTPFDPFGYTPMRRTERRLVTDYVDFVRRSAATLTPESYGDATAAAASALEVRGYESVKLANVERYRSRLAELGVSTSEGGIA